MKKDRSKDQNGSEARILRSTKSPKMIKNKVKNKGSKSLPNKKNKHLKHEELEETLTPPQSQSNCKKSLLKCFNDAKDGSCNDDVPLGKLLRTKNYKTSSSSETKVADFVATLCETPSTRRTLRPRRSLKFTPEDDKDKQDLKCVSNGESYNFVEQINSKELQISVLDCIQNAPANHECNSMGPNVSVIKSPNNKNENRLFSKIDKSTKISFTDSQIFSKLEDDDICLTNVKEKNNTNSSDCVESKLNEQSNHDSFDAEEHFSSCNEILNKIHEPSETDHVSPRKGSNSPLLLCLDPPCFEPSNVGEIKSNLNANNLLTPKKTEDDLTAICEGRERVNENSTCEQLPARLVIPTGSDQNGTEKDISPNKYPDGNSSMPICYNSPSTGILRKRKFQDGPDWTCSPSPKMRRVAFSEIISTLEIPNRHDDITRDLRQAGNEQTCRSEGSSIKGAQAANKENSTPIFPELIGSTSPIEVILARICSSPWVRGLKNLLSAKNIKTVGDIAMLSETELETLPIPKPKSSRIRDALQYWMDQINKNKKASSASRVPCRDTTFVEIIEPDVKTQSKDNLEADPHTHEKSHNISEIVEEMAVDCIAKSESAAEAVLNAFAEDLPAESIESATEAQEYKLEATICLPKPYYNISKTVEVMAVDGAAKDESATEAPLKPFEAENDEYVAETQPEEMLKDGKMVEVMDVNDIAKRESAGETALRALADAVLLLEDSSNKFSKTHLKAMLLRLAVMQNKVAELVADHL